MRTEDWKFGFIRGSRVVVFNEPIYSFTIAGSYFLRDVRIVIEENGLLRVTGSEIVFDLYINPTTENDWENEPEESEVQIRKVGWPWKRREERYLEGWVKTKKRIPFDVEFGSGWTLERRGE